VINECEETVKRMIHKYKQVVFISKSLGTIIAGEVHNRLGLSIKHIFITPLHDSVAFINSTEGIVIYGSNDNVFNKEIASQIKSSNHLRLIEVSNADHSLETGDVEENLFILRSLVSTQIDYLSKM